MKTNSKYVDVSAIMQVLGCVFQNPKVLDAEDKYSFLDEDFPNEFHKILFGSIYNLYHLGANGVSIGTIEDYLAQRPAKFAIYKANKGAEYLQQISEFSHFDTFDYYYSRMKKMTLLRMYKNCGLDVSWFYDADNILDVKKKQQQEERLDNTSLAEIADLIDRRIAEIRQKYAENTEDDFIQAGQSVQDLLEGFKNHSEIGYPLYGSLINTITRGARFKKFYLRSAATGVGKTRSMIADACFIACDKIFDLTSHQWIDNGTKEPTLFISTEQEEDEIQTMMLAFLSGVDEDHILENEYFGDEEERVSKAALVLAQSPLYIKKLPDFSLEDIENTIKYGIRQFGCRYIFHDYIHSSMKILSEVGSKAGVRNLREDNILFMISVKLKDICNKYGVFILTSTQLNAEYRTATQYDQNLLRGAKSIADKVDFGAIMIEVTPEDLESLKGVITQGGFEQPVIKISVYKNRRSKYKNILLWCKANRGTCRIEPMFVTNYQFELVAVNDLKIKITPDNSASAF